MLLMPSVGPSISAYPPFLHLSVSPCFFHDPAKPGRPSDGMSIAETEINGCAEALKHEP